MSSTQASNVPLSYHDSGVNIDAGNELVRRIGPVVRDTHRTGVLAGIGGFGALFELPWHRYQNPVLVSGTDGVGTKLKLAATLDCHDTIGIDLVAMCANDILVSGAEPLFFLDYFATGQLDVDMAQAVINGIAEGCKLAGCSLVGGETAEMPGMYSGNEYDLAGFAVGIVEKDKLLTPDDVRHGQILLGLASSGPHSNGFSLIREILRRKSIDTDARLGTTTIGQSLLEPTRIYVQSVLALLKSVEIKGLAHITGGGITENLPRVLPDDTQAVIDLSSWSLPAVFGWLQSNGGIATDEMLRTFNCGIGMITVVEEPEMNRAMSILREHGETVFPIGRVERSAGRASVRYESSWSD